MPGENENLVDDALASVDPAELEDVLGDITPNTEEPVAPADEPIVEPPTEEVPPAEEPVVEPVVETPAEPPVVETPAVPAAEPSPASEIETLKQQNEKLLRLVAELSGGTPPAETSPTGVSTAPVPSVPAPQSVTPAVAPPITVAQLDEMLDKMDFDSVMDNKEEFVKLIKGIATTIKAQSIEEGAQRMLTQLPQVVAGAVQRNATFREVQQKFFQDNKELLPVKGYVAKVANNIASVNPEWNIGQVLTEAAKTCYETLGIVKQIEDKEKKESVKPKLPGSGPGGKRQVTPPTGLQSEIDEILND